MQYKNKTRGERKRGERDRETENISGLHPQNSGNGTSIKGRKNARERERERERDPHSHLRHFQRHKSWPHLLEVT